MTRDHRHRNPACENAPAGNDDTRSTFRSFQQSQRRWIWHPPSVPDLTIKDIHRPERIDAASEFDDDWTVNEIIAALRWMREARHALDVCGQWARLFPLYDGNTRPPRAVCIDDDPDFMTVLQRRLEQLGFRVTGATDAVRGYRTVLHEQPDLVIADYFMPNEFGTYVLRRVKEDATLHRLPVIVLTGRDINTPFGPQKDVTLEDELRRLGAASVLRKPLNQRSLIRAVQSCLSFASESDQLPE